MSATAVEPVIRIGAATRVLAVGVDTVVIPALQRALPAGPLRVETAGDLLTAMNSLLGQEWDIVVASLGEDAESDLRQWLGTLDQARGHPRFIALVNQPFDAGVATAEQATLADVEARHITRVLESTGGRIMEAARVLGIHRNTLTRKLKEMSQKTASASVGTVEK